MLDQTVSELVKLKRKLYIELVSLARQNKLQDAEKLIYKLIRDDTPRYRCCQYKERAILKERIKLALGFDIEDDTPISQLAEIVDQIPLDENVINVLNLACDSCPIDKYIVTDTCRNCAAHRCLNACPKDAIYIISNKAYIDQEKCIECSRCKDVCPFGAINENIRPCVKACATGAISSDSNRQATIDKDFCVNCGHCIRGCPFGAIGDKNRIIQVTNSLLDHNQKTVALLAPSFPGQFGYNIDSAIIKTALKIMGFDQVIEVAEGAEKVMKEEAREILELKETDASLMTSSCCPAFTELITKSHPEFSKNISSLTSPMEVSAASIKRQSPEAKTVFIGPCLAKKAEAVNHNSVDEVLTFEELLCMMVAWEINLEKLNPLKEFNDSISDQARSFPTSGAVAAAINSEIPESKKSQINFQVAAGLEECSEFLKKYKPGNKISFLEGMGCQDGCIGGPGTVINSKIAKKMLEKYINNKNNDNSKRVNPIAKF
ncbi:MAG: monomeric [FeFe] hydrogenase [Halanaerobiaceae bacterium]